MTRKDSEQRVSFVVRIVQDPDGGITGVVERVATGAKERFASVEMIGQVISKMLRQANSGGERDSP